MTSKQLRLSFIFAAAGSLLAAAGGYVGGIRSVDDLLDIASVTGVPAVIRPIVALGLSQSAKNNALILAAGRGNTGTVKALLNEGAQVHASEDLAIVSAAFNGKAATVQALLDRGANPNAANGAPLIWSATNGHTETVALLCDRGADVHILNDMPINAAARHGNVEIVRLLAERSKSGSASALTPLSRP